MTAPSAPVGDLTIGTALDPSGVMGDLRKLQQQVNRETGLKLDMDAKPALEAIDQVKADVTALSALSKQDAAARTQAARLLGTQYAATTKSLQVQTAEIKQQAAATAANTAKLREQGAQVSLNLRLASEARRAEKERSQGSINALDAEVRAMRNLWQTRVLSNEQVFQQQGRLRQQALEMALTVDKQSDAYRRLTQVAAQAQRTMDQSQGINTPGGFGAGIEQGIAGVLSQFGVAGDLLGGFVQLIAAKRAAAQNTAAELGEDTMQGLIAGMKNNQAQVKQVAGNSADAIADAIRKNLDIHSPSRVMEYLGRMVGDGFVAGIRSRYDEVKRAASGMSDAARNGVSTQVGAATSVGGRTGGVGGLLLPAAVGGALEAGKISNTTDALAGMNKQLQLNASASLEAATAGATTEVATEALGGAVEGAAEQIQSFTAARQEGDEAARESAINEAKTAMAFTAVAAGITAVTAAFVVSMNTAANYEQAMSKAAATTEATGAQLVQLDAIARSDRLSKLGVGGTEAAAGIEELGSQGLNTAQILDGALEDSLLLAKAVGTDVATAGGIAAASVKAFGLEAEDLGEIVDIVTVGVNGTSIKIDNFKDSIAAGGAQAKASGVDFTNFTGVISFLTDKALSASDAGTSVKNFLMALTPNSKAAAAEMKRLGFNAFDAQGNFKSLGAIADNLRESFGDMTPEMQATTAEMIFGSDGARVFFALMEQGSKGLAARTEQLSKMGAAEEAAAKKMEGFRGQQQIFNATLENFKIMVGTGFLPGANKMLEWATDFLGKIVKINQELSAVKSPNDIHATLQITAKDDTTTAIIKFFGGIGEGTKTLGGILTGKWAQPYVDAKNNKTTVTQTRDALVELGVLTATTNGEDRGAQWRRIEADLPKFQAMLVKAIEKAAAAIEKAGKPLAASSPLALQGQTGTQIAQAFFKAIYEQESKSSGGYSAFNTDWANKGQGAVGKYQVMPFNLISPESYNLPQAQRGAYARANMDTKGQTGFGWDFKATGKDYTLREILDSPELQEKIGQYKLNEYLTEELRRNGGNVEKAVKAAAARWYGTGTTNGPSTQAYSASVFNKFRAGMPQADLAGQGALLPGQQRALEPDVATLNAGILNAIQGQTGNMEADTVAGWCARWVRMMLVKAAPEAQKEIEKVFGGDAKQISNNLEGSPLLQRDMSKLKPGDVVIYDDHIGVYMGKNANGQDMVRGNNLWGQQNGRAVVSDERMTSLGTPQGFVRVGDVPGVVRPAPVVFEAPAGPKSDAALFKEAKRILARVEATEKSGDLTANVKADRVLKAFSESGPRAAAALEYVQAQVKATDKVISQYGQGFDKLKGQLDVSGSLYKLNEQTPQYLKSLDSIAVAASKAAQVERDKNKETAKYRALLELAGDASSKAANLREAAQRSDEARNKARLQNQEDFNKALADNNESEARRALARLKTQQAQDLAAAKDNAAKKAQIIAASGPAIIRAENQLANLRRDQLVKQAGETARLAGLVEGADLEAIEKTRRLAVKKAYKEAADDRAQAQRESSETASAAGRTRIEEEARFAKELSELKIQQATATAARLKARNDADIRAHEGDLQKQLELTRKYSQQEYDDQVKILIATKTRAFRDAEGKPNQKALRDLATTQYDTGLEGLKTTRAEAVRKANEAVLAEQKIFDVELAALNIEAARQSDARLTVQGEQHIKRFEGNLQKQLALTKHYGQLQYEREVRIATKVRDAALDAARGTANEGAARQVAFGAFAVAEQQARFAANDAVAAAREAIAASAKDARDNISQLAQGLREKVDSKNVTLADLTAYAEDLNVMRQAIDKAGLSTNVYVQAALKNATALEQQAFAAGVSSGAFDQLTDSHDRVRGVQGRYTVSLQDVLENLPKAADATAAYMQTLEELAEAGILSRDVLKEVEAIVANRADDMAAFTAAAGDLATESIALADAYDGLGDTQMGLAVLYDSLDALFLRAEDGQEVGDSIDAVTQKILALQNALNADTEFDTFLAGLTGSLSGQIAAVTDQLASETDVKMRGRLLELRADLQQQFAQSADFDVQGAGFTPKNEAEGRALTQAGTLLEALRNETDPAQLQGIMDQMGEFLASGLGRLLPEAVRTGLEAGVTSADGYIKTLQEITGDAVVDGWERASKTLPDGPTNRFLDLTQSVFDLKDALKDPTQAAALTDSLNAARLAGELTSVELEYLLRLVKQLQDEEPLELIDPPNPDRDNMLDLAGRGITTEKQRDEGSIGREEAARSLLDLATDAERYAAAAERAGKADLAGQFRELAANAREAAGSVGKLMEVQRYAGYVQELAGGFAQLFETLGEGDEQMADIGANLRGAENLAGKVVALAGDIARIVANPADIGAWVGAITKIVSGIAEALSGFQKAKAEAKRIQEDFNKGFTLINGDNYSKTFVRSRGWLADTFGGGPEVKQEINELGLKIAQSIEGGLVNGIKNGLKTALTTGNWDEFSNTFRKSAFEGVVDGVIEAVFNKALQDILAPGIKALTDAAETEDTSDDAAAVDTFTDRVKVGERFAMDFGQRINPSLDRLRGNLGISTDDLNTGGVSGAGSLASLPEPLQFALATPLLEGVRGIKDAGTMFQATVSNLDTIFKRGVTINVNGPSGSYSSSTGALSGG
ncbi:phage tail tape measure protein [Deinococcus sp. QL22]|uniref:phage tail tape measure protein n=1 Tax=Deinococcus sp. QL22 TaxID=2939437 RepID=UPI002017A564|nr:phage tail tape measure protein [Deinococcus sp. QL22]UQN06759.1 phage tail tape measure protein [Deinococcus sp. QL22]